MAEYFVLCNECPSPPNTKATYPYRPKVKDGGSQITISFGEMLSTNADIPKLPICPKCGAEGEWVVTH